jgi:hypothetical protein
MSKPYQRYIGFGLPVVPLIHEELQREPDQWFSALESITEQNPVPPEAKGTVRWMAQAWIDWRKQQRYLMTVALISSSSTSFQRSLKAARSCSGSLASSGSSRMLARSESAFQC